MGWGKERLCVGSGSHYKNDRHGLHEAPLWDVGTKVYGWDLGHVTKIVAMSIYG